MLVKSKTFKLQNDLIHKFKHLSDEDSGRLFKNIFRFINEEPINIENDLKELYEEIISDINSELIKKIKNKNKYHWNYKGGITPENKIIRNSSLMKSWRLRVFEKDNYTCKICDKKGGVLNAHHIKPFALFKELRFELFNGMTLCKKCHIEIHKKNN